MDRMCWRFINILPEQWSLCLLFPALCLHWSWLIIYLLTLYAFICKDLSNFHPEIYPLTEPSRALFHRFIAGLPRALRNVFSLPSWMANSLFMGKNITSALSSSVRTLHVSMNHFSFLVSKSSSRRAILHRNGPLDPQCQCQASWQTELVPFACIQPIAL